MKKLLLAPVFLLLSTLTWGQYGNEWINYDQQYLKISIVQDGIYRIDSASLADAFAGIGQNLAQVDPQDIQMFGRQEQLAIYIEGEADGVFNSGDFIEFRALGNDGWFDTQMYDQPQNHSNPYYSFHNDTATYYLTVDKVGAPSRRMTVETDVDTATYPTISDYYWATSYWENHNRYYSGESQNQLSMPRITAGEGWFDIAWSSSVSGVSKNRTAPTPNAYIGGPDANVETVFATTNDPETNPYGADNQHITVEMNGVVLMDTMFRGYRMVRRNFPLANANLSNSATLKFTNITAPDNISTAKGIMAVAHVTATYPATYNMSNGTSAVMEVPNGPGLKTHIAFTNFNSTAPLLYSEIDGAMRRIPVLSSGGQFHALIPNTVSGISKCYLYDTNSIVNLTNTEVVPVTENNAYFVNYTAVALDSAFIIVTHKDHMSEVNQYAAYRNLTGHNPIVVDVEELYHQFGAGIYKHPEALKHFFDYAYDNWPTPPRHVFLVGKSIRAAGQPHWNDGSRRTAANYVGNKVPSYGYPCSDLLYVTDLDNLNHLRPEISIGRLSVQTNEEILDYLTKVQEHEALGEEEWRKHILHFGGGSNPAEQSSFANYLRIFENEIEDSLFGGYVHTFLKESSAPIEINLSDSVKDLIEGGVSIMTFFGHASGAGFDQNIDDPENYENKGKYPFVIGNSCYSGDLHEPSYSSTSEHFVLIKDKGMIGFLASVKQGLDVYLFQYSTALYENLAHRSYGLPIGEVIGNTIEDIEGISPGYTFQEENVSLSMNLHGDPAIVLYSPEKPDFQVTPTDIFFNPGTITADVDSFDINVVVTNIGKSSPDSIVVLVERTLPNGEVLEYQKALYGLHYKDTLIFRVLVDQIEGLGLNRFDVHVDIPTYVEELPGKEIVNNQILGVDLLILTGGIIPIYPYDYAIVPDSVITLKASTGDLWADHTDFIFEIDTTDKFNSPFKISKVVNAPGGVVEWVPLTASGDPLVMTDSTVYFWRVTADTLWRERSFQYIKGRRGWGQAHFFQFKNNDYSKVKYNRTLSNRTFDFKKITSTLSITTRGWDVNNFTSDDFEKTGYSIDGTVQDEHGCNFFHPSLHVIVIDSATLEPWRTYGKIDNNSNTFINPQHRYGNANDSTLCNAPRDRTEGFFIYKTNHVPQMAAIENLIVNEVPDGNFIAIYTWTYLTQVNINGTNPNFGPLLSSMGATQFNAVDSVPYIFFCRKGDPSSAIELYGDSTYANITLEALIEADHPFGNITSEVAGPAYSWDALHWAQHASETNTADTSTIHLIGRTVAGVDSTLAEFSIYTDSVVNLASYIDATKFPFARIQLFTEDDSLATPAQMERWQLIYSPVPEAAINPAAGYTWNIDSVQEGDNLSFAIAIENISEYNMDSLLVNYWIEDKDRQRHDLPYDRQAPLLVDGILMDTITFNTVDFPGKNYIWIEVNPIPNDSATTFDQLEQYHFNNLAVREFNVSTDKINPLIDITFDGLHIMDGEVVSAKPMITMSLDDENPFLLMDAITDTANFTVWVTDPNGNQKRIYFSNSLGEEIMVFTPAQDTDNKCLIEYKGDFPTDGVYQLLVQAQDKSENQSANISYKINFEIINRSTVTEVLNYPNPFSTSTRFVFTLTGSEVPTYFKIQIMTITGRVVKELDQDELGPMRIGRNMTEYAWDGTDEFGDPLANGIYLYRVVVKDFNLEDVEYRATSASRFFKKGMGKMYLMR